MEKLLRFIYLLYSFLSPDFCTDRSIWMFKFLGPFWAPWTMGSVHEASNQTK